MSERHQIMGDESFWTQLEYDATNWLWRTGDKKLRPFWIDGFTPEIIRNTQRGVDVDGIAWVGRGPREQWPYRFVVFVPQKMLHRGRQAFSIEQLSLDEEQQELRMSIGGQKPAVLIRCD